MSSRGSTLTSASMRAWNARSSGDISASSRIRLCPVSTICAYMRALRPDAQRFPLDGMIRYTFRMRQRTSVSFEQAQVARWIARTLANDPPRTRSLIVTMWGDALAPHGGHVWLTTLIRLMAPFGVSERLVRTSVFRLVRDGWLVGEARGRRSRYRLTADGERRFAHAHQRIYAPANGHWRGDWELVIAPPDAVDAGPRRALFDELAWEGYGQVAPAVLARPLDGASTARDIIAALGLSSRVVLARAHDAGQCFIVRTLLVHAYRRVLLRDPQLPAALLPADWPGSAAYALTRDFYRLTHAVAERHLAAAFAAAGETLPRADPAFYQRFGGLR